MENMKYVLVLKDIEKLRKEEEYYLTQEDIIYLNNGSGIFGKFLKMKCLSLQMEIGSGEKEQNLYTKVIQELEKIAEDMDKQIPLLIKEFDKK